MSYLGLRCLTGEGWGAAPLGCGIFRHLEKHPREDKRTRTRKQNPKYGFLGRCPANEDGRGCGFLGPRHLDPQKLKKNKTPSGATPP